MTVFLSVGRFIVADTGMVTGADPQLNVTMPPAATAALSAVNALGLVQLAAVPLPITAVGVDTSTSFPPAGTPVEQLLSETGPPSGAPPEEPLLLPLPLEDPPLLEPLPPPEDPPLDELAAPEELPELLLAPEELGGPDVPASPSEAWPGAPEEQAGASRHARKRVVVFMLIGALSEQEDCRTGASTPAPASSPVGRRGDHRRWRRTRAFSTDHIEVSAGATVGALAPKGQSHTRTAGQHRRAKWWIAKAS
jgi:hypothetical protein